MKEKITEILEDRAKEATQLWDVFKYYFEIKIDEKNKIVEIEVERESYLGGFLSYDLLEKLSILLKTKLIDVSNELKIPGCPTCDYGETHFITITAREVCFS